jgi:hypothetical protein
MLMRRGNGIRQVAGFMEKPLVIDLFCGRFGWSKGFLSEGYRAIGFDLEQMGPVPEGAELARQDVLTIHGSQFRHAAAIVASPPCQKYSYMAMPWDRAKREIRWWEWERDSPFGHFTLNDLFNACFRIQREASEAAGHHIPMVVENVVGAQRWVGSAKWHFGSYYLWGDVPALMPFTKHMKNNGGSWFGQRDGKELERNDPRDLRRDENGQWSNAAATGGWNHPGKALDGRKNSGGSWFSVAHNTESGHSRNPVHELAGVKHGGDCFNDPDWPGKAGGTKQHGSGAEWFDNGICKSSSRSDSRKAASALIAEIPFDLAQWIAKCFKPSPHNPSDHQADAHQQHSNP